MSSSEIHIIPCSNTGFHDTEAHRIFLGQKYFPLLDGLRCLSIIAVVWHHAAGEKLHTGILSHGDEGVSLFFVISGFLITTLLLREQSTTGDISLNKFYLRRTFRIFPLYYAILILYVLLVYFVEKGSQPGSQFWSNLPYYLTYTSNWFVQLNSDRVIFIFAWSLATEEQFYLFWPWIVKAGRSSRLPLAAMVALLVLYYGTTFAVAKEMFSSTWLFTRLVTNLSPAICLGAIAAILMHEPTTFRWIERATNWRWSAATALTFTLAALALNNVSHWVFYVGMTWLVVACALRPIDQPLGRFFTNSLVKHIGVVSYGIYLMNLLALNVVRRLLHSDAGSLAFVSALALSVVAATLSYRFFESPFLRWKDRLAKRPDAITL